MLFLHGALGSKNDVTHLLDSESRVLEFPSHGTNTESIESMTIETLANWTLNQDTSLEKVFGYSMGGYVALYLSAKKLAPIKKIVTYGSILNWTPKIYEVQSKFLDPKNIEDNIPKLATILEKTHGANWKELVLKTLELMKDLSIGNSLSDDDFKNIDAEVIFIVGSKDRMVSISDTERVSDLNPNFKMHVLDERPHELFKVPKEELKIYFT